MDELASYLCRECGERHEGLPFAYYVDAPLYWREEFADREGFMLTERSLDLWTTPGRESEPPYFGWLSTELPYEPTTVNLKTHVQTQPVRSRPHVEVEHTNHPLAVEQHHGITVARVREIAERMAHR